MNNPKKVAIIGAGASGLMVADVLANYPSVQVSVYEQMPSAGRKILMAGKTGLNVSNNKPTDEFIAQYRPSMAVAPFVSAYPSTWLVDWLDKLGVPTFVGSTGRIFPKVMKTAPFLRAWLNRLHRQGVQIFYRHRCVGLNGNRLSFEHTKDGTQFGQEFDVIVLACGGGSYARLGSDGAWQAWFGAGELTPFYASNVGVVRSWSPFMQDFFGQAIKRVRAWVSDKVVSGDIIISHYGLESGVIYQLNHELRAKQDNAEPMVMYLDLLPDVSLENLTVNLTKLSQNKKQTLNNQWRKVGLDSLKIALLRECTPKDNWTNPTKMAQAIKKLKVSCDGFRPIDEAISTGGGVKFDSVHDNLQLKSNPYVFVCGEMLDWDAPTGGYLLTACFAMGQMVGQNVVKVLELEQNGG